jgi:hypothetical protein
MVEGRSRVPGRPARRGALAVLAIATLVAQLLGGPIGATAASRTDYPTWADVTAARASEAATARQVAAIQALLKQLETRLAEARADEIAKGEAFEEAQYALDLQIIVTDGLVAQAEAARAEAADAKERASRMLSMLARAGGGDLVANLLGDASNADTLLYRLEAMDRLSEQSNGLYVEAVQLQNSADALSDQAQIARVKRDELRVFAEEALEAARQATVAADEAVAEQQDHQAELEAQLSVLVEKRQATEKDYAAGVAAREAARKAAEAAARAAAAAAAAARGANAAGWRGRRADTSPADSGCGSTRSITTGGCTPASISPARGAVRRSMRRTTGSSPTRAGTAPSETTCRSTTATARRRATGTSSTAASWSVTGRASRPVSRSHGSGRRAHRPDATCTSWSGSTAR